MPAGKSHAKRTEKRNVDHLKVVYSEEEPVGPHGDVVGSVAFVPSVAGLIIAGEVVKDLAEVR